MSQILFTLLEKYCHRKGSFTVLSGLFVVDNDSQKMGVSRLRSSAPFLQMLSNYNAYPGNRTLRGTISVTLVLSTFMSPAAGKEKNLLAEKPTEKPAIND